VIRVLNTLALDEAQLGELASVSAAIEIVDRRLAPEELDRLCDDGVEVLIAGRPPRDVRQMPALRWLQVPSAGVEQLAGCVGLDRIVVTNARGVYSIPMAEYVLWALLDFNQRGDTRRALHQRRVWDEPSSLGRPLRGQTLLIIGYGSTGREIARLADAFGMRIVAVKADPRERADHTFHQPGTGDPDGRLPQHIGDLDELPELAAAAGAVVVTLPLTAATRGAIGASVLAALQPGVVIVNVGRGPTIDREALLGALRDGGVERAVIDVFASEPLDADAPEWGTPGLLVTPHVSGGVDNAPLVALLVENLRRYLAGADLLNRVAVDRIA
jgi:phosphoglycerate dehydrogenase-like enzyme